MRNPVFQPVLICFLLLSAGQVLLAGGEHPPKAHADLPVIKDIRFVENRNQWDDRVRFMAEIPGGAMFLENNRFTWSYCDMTDFHDRYYHSRGNPEKIEVLDCHAFRMEFEGANENPTLLPSDKYDDYRNFFIGNDPAKWAGGVPIFGQVLYEGLYDGIDLRMYGREKSAKYDLIVAAGADPAKIQVEYSGLDAIEVEDGNLVLKTSIGEIIEQKPFAYQVFNGKIVEIPSKFVVVGTRMHFEFPEGYDAARTLIIDPNLIFSSFTGSTADNFGYTATYDTAGNLYAGGVVFNAGTYPTTTGAFQTTFQGGGIGGLFGPIDISISKFNSTGTAFIYSTYLGGNQNEQPHSLIVTEAGELIVYGRTYSTNFPTASPAQGANAGGADICVTKFNVAGTGLLGSTYLGGSLDDAVNVTTTFGASSIKWNYGDDARGEVMLDDNDNVYIASCTQSSNLPVTAGVVQGANAGMQDGVIAKFTPDLSTITYLTYLGGTGNDAAYSIKLDAANNAYIAGGTQSTNYHVTPGVYQGTSGGGIDGYITILNPTASNIVASTYTGTSAYDQAFFLEIDLAGDVYIYGQTEGNWPVSTGVYSNANGAQFIQKFDPQLLNTIFSTRFGSGSTLVNISPTAFLVDICGFIYVAGWGGSTNHAGTTGNTNGMPYTSDAFDSTTTGSDVWLGVFGQDATSLVYGTFMGGDQANEHVDGGTSRFNKDLEVYHAVCSNCGGITNPYPAGGFPVQPANVVGPNMNSTNCNLAAFKFGFDPQNIEANFSSSNIIACAPFTITFTNNSTPGASYYWTFGDGDTSTAVNPTHSYIVPDTYTVVLQIIDSSSCNVVDTAVRIITIVEQPIAATSLDTTACNGAPVQLNASGGQNYQWIPSTGLTNDTIPDPWATPTQTTTYAVVVSNPGGCADTGYVTVTVTSFQAEAGLNASFCEGTGGAMLSGGGQGGVTPYYYTWWCDSTNTWCGLDSVFDNDPIANPTQSTWYYLQLTDFNGCISFIDSVWVEVLENPIVDAGPDKYTCPPPGPGALLNANVVNSTGAPGPYTYAWTPAAGLNDSTILNPFANPDTTTIYTLIVTASGNGCTSHPTTVDTLSSVTVHVKPLPVADAGPDVDLCLYDSTKMQGIGTNAGPIYKFEWSPSTGLSSDTHPSPMASPPYTFTYTLVVWSNGCPSYGDSVTVNIHTQPTPDAGPDREICLGENALLDGNAGGDSSATGYNFMWTPAYAIVDPAVEDAVASPDSTTTYYVVATSQPWGCDSPVDSMTVFVKPTPIAEAGPNLVLCDGDSATLLGGYFYTTTDSVPNPNQIWYTWSPANSLSDPNIAQPNAQPPTTQEYTLTVQYNTCITKDSMLVTLFPEIGARADADTNTICGGESVQLYGWGGLGNASFNWIPAAGLNDATLQNPVASPGDSTTYMLVVEESGCTDTVEVVVNVIPLPSVSYLNSLDAGCADWTVNFLENTADAIQWIWDFGDGSPVSNEQNPTHTYAEPGIYTVTLTGVGQGNCAASVSTTGVHVFGGADGAFSSIPAHPALMNLPNTEVQFYDKSNHAEAWFWDFGDGTISTEQHPKHRFVRPGEYYVTLKVTTPEGCTEEITHGPYKVVTPGLFIPNVFSPNGHGDNDLFIVDYSGSQPFHLKVFDRWGVMHYESRDKNEGWNGQISGVQSPEGVYFYSLRIGEKEYAGNVTLLR